MDRAPRRDSARRLQLPDKDGACGEKSEAPEIDRQSESWAPSQGSTGRRVCPGKGIPRSGSAKPDRPS